jgi:hypothetical protein
MQGAVVVCWLKWVEDALGEACSTYEEGVYAHKIVVEKSGGKK